MAAAVPMVQAPDTAPPTISIPDVVRVELGYGLLDLAGGASNKLPDQIKRFRRALAAELGFVLPSVRIQDNVELDPYAYAFALKEITAGKGELRPTMLLAISPGDHAAPIAGEKTVEPTFGLPACWIAPGAAEQARASQWTVVDPSTVLTTHLAEVVKENIAEFLSYTETQKILGGLPADQQRLVADLVPNTITTGGLQRVLQMLLAERISIRDMPAILEAIQEACAGSAKAVAPIVAHVRTRLARQISDSLAAEAGYIAVIVLSQDWEETMASALVGTPEDRQLALGQEKLKQFLDRVRPVVEAAVQAGEKPALLTSSQIRYHIYSIVDRIRLNVPVIAQTEVHRRAQVKVVATI
jgi:flagellar biosynthesis protein FlhA